MMNRKLVWKLVDAATEVVACGLNGANKKPVMSNDKLVELTVKECMSVINDCVSRYQPASTYSAELAQHFGIDHENKS